MDSAPHALPVILGPADDGFLDLRLEAGRRLRERGHRALVLEDYPEREGEPLMLKWERLLREEAPTDFFIVLPRGCEADGAHVEFGYLMARLTPRELARRVRFFLEDGTEPRDALATYEEELVDAVGVDRFHDVDGLVGAMARRLEERVT